MEFRTDFWTDFWTDMARPAPSATTVDGTEVRKGSRVRLRPRAHGDAMDAMLAGRVAIVEGIDEDDAGAVRLSVTLEDDPGRDLGDARQPGHRFFFAPEELEPLGTATRILVAGIGNVFLGDDGFGVAVARALAARALPAGVLVADFGIRGLDLAYALQDYDAAILVDAAPRGDAPGTLYVIAPDDGVPAELPPDGHGMHPARVLALARRLGRVPARTLIVGCEPLSLEPAESAVDSLVALSEPVRAAIEPAARLVASLLEEIRKEESR